MNSGMTRAAALLWLACAATPAAAFIPQTIVVDGANDFNIANRIDVDGGDTETKDWCTNDPAVESPMDLLDIYITNDNSFLYVGFGYDKDCFADPKVNLGMAINVGTGGSTTDPFSRKISWNATKSTADTTVQVIPDYVVYDVLDGFNYEVIYETNGAGGWNPLTAGANSLGIFEAAPFVEFKIPLSTLDFARAGGAIAGDLLHVEWWMTQDGTLKPPLDAAASDARQKSVPGGPTVFDVTGSPIDMNRMFPYTLLAITDVTPPTVSSARATGFALQPNRQFALTTNKVSVTFSEPVDLTTAQTPGNYSITGVGGVSVTSAVRNPVQTELVELTLTSAISAQVPFFNVTVTGVKDQANNTIVNNGTTNIGAFFIQNLVFTGDVSVGLCKGIFAPVDTFAIEGSLSPLTFDLCDNALMTDGNADSVYETTVPFCMTKGGNGLAEADLEWKMSRRCNEFEPLSGNRVYHMSSSNGPSVILFGFWNNDDPSNFTSRAVDVIFNVNATRFAPTAADTIRLLGSQSPLSFTQPGLLMTGVGGNVYRRTVRFPKCTAKNVQWKVDFNGVIECAGQGDRNVFLNDALFDTVGGAGGPITLPARGIDRCTVTDKPIRAVFRIDMRFARPDPGPSDTVAVMGNRPPLSFTPPPISQVRLMDDGFGFDTIAGDITFSGGIVFPDSTEFRVEYKHWLDGVFECNDVGNRFFDLDDVNHSVGNPIVRPLAYWDYCSDVTGVPEVPKPSVTGFATLNQNYPNPFNPTTVISFNLRESGATRLRIYDVAGRNVATLMDRDLKPGEYEVEWTGTDSRGNAVSSGIYFYELSQAGKRISRRMVLMQ